MTTSLAVARQLTLSWGINAVASQATEKAGRLRDAIVKQLRRLGLGDTGGRVVVTAGLPLGQSDSTNVIRVFEID